MKINVKEITIHWAEGDNQKYDKFPNPTKSDNVIGEHIKDFLNNIIKNNENDKEDRTNANNFINNYQL